MHEKRPVGMGGERGGEGATARGGGQASRGTAKGPKRAPRRLSSSVEHVQGRPSACVMRWAWPRPAAGRVTAYKKKWTAKGERRRGHRRAKAKKKKDCTAARRPPVRARPPSLPPPLFTLAPSARHQCAPTTSLLPGAAIAQAGFFCACPASAKMCFGECGSVRARARVYFPTLAPRCCFFFLS